METPFKGTGEGNSFKGTYGASPYKSKKCFCEMSAFSSELIFIHISSSHIPPHPQAPRRVPAHSIGLAKKFVLFFP